MPPKTPTFSGGQIGCPALASATTVSPLARRPVARTACRRTHPGRPRGRHCWRGLRWRGWWRVSARLVFGLAGLVFGLAGPVRVWLVRSGCGWSGPGAAGPGPGPAGPGPGPAGPGPGPAGPVLPARPRPSYPTGYQPPPRRPRAAPANGVDASFMQLERHDRGIHIVSAGRPAEPAAAPVTRGQQ
jgi:hypothetical protein